MLCYGTLLEKFGGRGLIQMALPEPLTCEPADVSHPPSLILILKVLNLDFRIIGVDLVFCFPMLKLIYSDFKVCTRFPLLVLGFFESIKFWFQNNWCELGSFFVSHFWNFYIQISKLDVLIFHYWILNMKVFNPDFFRHGVDFFLPIVIGLCIFI